MEKKRGFTLIELLVVVAIIGILATVVVVNLSGAQAKARDSKRKSDLASIQTAISLYKLDNGTVPLSANAIKSRTSVSVYGTNKSTCSINGDGADASVVCVGWDTLIPTTYLSAMPKDPTNTFTTRSNYSAYAYTVGETNSYGCTTSVRYPSNSGVVSPYPCYEYALFTKMEKIAATDSNYALKGDPGLQITHNVWDGGANYVVLGDPK